jgi:hypothetical protein
MGELISDGVIIVIVYLYVLDKFLFGRKTINALIKQNKQIETLWAHLLEVSEKELAAREILENE